MDKFTTLIQVKVISILITITYCYLVATGKVSPDVFQSVFIMVISFYFGQSSARNYVNKLENKESVNNGKNENDHTS